jgi:hypothetical protein
MAERPARFSVGTDPCLSPAPPLSDSGLGSEALGAISRSQAASTKRQSFSRPRISFARLLHRPRCPGRPCLPCGFPRRRGALRRAAVPIAFAAAPLQGSAGDISCVPDCTFLRISAPAAIGPGPGPARPPPRLPRRPSGRSLRPRVSRRPQFGGASLRVAVPRVRLRRHPAWRSCPTQSPAAVPPPPPATRPSAPRLPLKAAPRCVCGPRRPRGGALSLFCFLRERPFRRCAEIMKLGRSRQL